MAPSRVVLENPGWITDIVDWNVALAGDEVRMRLAIRLARENVERDTGGPFAALIVERESGRLVSVGVNSVVRLNNSAAHGEIMAFMMAQERLGSFTLGAPGKPAHDLVTTCEPCAMCLGAILWSGVTRVVAGATRDDAIAQGFEEGPVFAESWKYLESRGIAITRGVLRDKARAVLDLYRERGGAVYNG